MRSLNNLLRRLRGEPEAAPPPIPDPALPPARRGTWQEAALTNVEITETVKRQIRSTTRPEQR